MPIAILSDFKDAARFFEALPNIAPEAAMLAINSTANGPGLAILRKDVESQVAYPSGYLDQENRLGVVKRATRSDLTAVIRGRDRPTSLARFAPGQSVASTKGKGVVVRVSARGKTRHLKKAFLVTLKNNNIGLAVRLKKGERLRNSEKAVQLGNNLYLLYGPSVDQVMASVADSRAPLLGNMAGKEFIRQIARLSRG